MAFGLSAGVFSSGCPGGVGSDPVRTYKMDYWEEMGKFLERYSAPRLNQEEIERKYEQTRHKH